MSKELEQEKEIRNKVIAYIEACKTSLGNYILSPSETEMVLNLLKENNNNVNTDTL